MPSPSEVVTPKIVVRIAIISIKTANGLFLDTVLHKMELNLNGSFLLYEANAPMKIC